MEARPRATIEEELRSALQAAGHRFTQQRAAVYTFLQNTTSHPTADDIFTHVREDIPDISLATVYKALEAFVAAGAAQKLEFGGGPARYDARTDDHHHVRCIECASVRDIEEAGRVDLDGWSESDHGFQVVGYRLELLGYCPGCRN